MVIEITPEQVIIIGFVAMLLIQGLKLWKATSGTEFSQITLTWILFGVSLVMAFFWAAPSMPALPVLTGDPTAVSGAIFSFIGTLVAVASAVAGFATLVYNVLAKAVFDGMGLNSQKVAANAK
jgi:hypothetical protein